MAANRAETAVNVWRNSPQAGIRLVVRGPGPERLCTGLVGPAERCPERPQPMGSQAVPF